MSLTFGEKIKEARKSQNLTQKQLAEEIGAKHNSVSDWENDKNKPDPDTIELLCGVLKITPNYLLNSSKEDFSPKEKQIIKKYNELDLHGKEMVDFTLQKEWERSTAEAKAKEKVVPMAVRENTNYADGATEEEMTYVSQYMKKNTDYLAVKAAHNDAETTDAELEKMERDSALIVEMAKKKR